jgi:hypothetical protein
MKQLLIACLELHNLAVCIILNLLCGGLILSCPSIYLIVQLWAAESATEVFNYFTARF